MVRAALGSRAAACRLIGALSCCAAVVRYDVVHPVVNDSEMVLWRGLGVSSWPTLAVVSPQGRLIAMVAGEGHREDISDIVAAALEVSGSVCHGTRLVLRLLAACTLMAKRSLLSQFYGEQGLLDNTPLPLELERDKDPSLAASPLRFPGKVATDLAGGRLFIADSSNNRIVVTDLTGQFQEAIGCGAPGLLDGSFEEAAFAKPQGLAYSRMVRTNLACAAEAARMGFRTPSQPAPPSCPPRERAARLPAGCRCGEPRAARGGLQAEDCQDGCRCAAAAHRLSRCLRRRCALTSPPGASVPAGSGAKGSDYRGGSGGTSQLLNSPWDVVFDRRVLFAAAHGACAAQICPVAAPSSAAALGCGCQLCALTRCRSEQYAYVAMAGQHQVWRLDVAAGTIENFSGTGYERNQNGADALTTAWAQPSGLSLSPSGDSVYVAGAFAGRRRTTDGALRAVRLYRSRRLSPLPADSESSTVRQLDLRTGGSQPCVGGDNLFADNLFRFGDRDGSGADALLQHPLAVLATPAGTGALRLHLRLHAAE